MAVLKLNLYLRQIKNLNYQANNNCRTLIVGAYFLSENWLLTFRSEISKCHISSNLVTTIWSRWESSLQPCGQWTILAMMKVSIKHDKCCYKNKKCVLKHVSLTQRHGELNFLCYLKILWTKQDSALDRYPESWLFVLSFIDILDE